MENWIYVAALHILCKVYEKLVAIQITKHVESSCFLRQSISGFSKGNSTMTVFPRIRDDTLKAMKKREVALTEFADFSKAFNKLSYFTIVQNA